MIRDGGTRFRKGQSGNPSGRPRKRRPDVSAFDIVFDQTLTVTQGDVERELTVDEGLQLQTYQAALKGSRMAVRTVLKMIEKREAALTKKNPPICKPIAFEIEHDSPNANKAMQILGIAEYGEAPPGGGPATRSLKLATWAVQEALSRPGRRSSPSDIDAIKDACREPHRIKWPRRRSI